MFQLGTLHEKSQDLGLYDECANLNLNTNTTAGIIEGKYCVLTAIKKSWVEIKMFFWKMTRIGKFSIYGSFYVSSGLCVPKSCSSDDVWRFSNQILKQNQMAFVKTQFSSNDPVQFKFFDYFAM